MKATVAVAGREDVRASGERPTVPSWAVAKIRELRLQLDRLLAGVACRECMGSGALTVGGLEQAVYDVACGRCDGSGVDAPEEKQGEETDPSY